MAKVKVEKLIDENLHKFCKYINHVRQQDEDFAMLISGQTRSGKSTLALEIAMLVDANFNMNEQILFSIKDLAKKVYETKGKVFIMDEAIFEAYNREAMNYINRYLIKLLTVCAERNHVIILIIPKVKWLDKPVRERISYMFYTMKEYTPTGIKRGVYHAYDWTNFNPFEDIEFPSYAWTGYFKPLPGYIYEKYSVIKLENVMKKLDVENENPLKFMSKTEIAKCILNDERFKHVSKADLYKIFGNVVYRL